MQHRAVYLTDARFLKNAAKIAMRCVAESGTCAAWKLHAEDAFATLDAFQFPLQNAKDSCSLALQQR